MLVEVCTPFVSIQGERFSVGKESNFHDVVYERMSSTTSHHEWGICPTAILSVVVTTPLFDFWYSSRMRCYILHRSSVFLVLLLFPLPTSFCFLFSLAFFCLKTLISLVVLFLYFSELSLFLHHHDDFLQRLVNLLSFNHLDPCRHHTVFSSQNIHWSYGGCQNVIVTPNISCKILQNYLFLRFPTFNSRCTRSSSLQN